MIDRGTLAELIEDGRLRQVSSEEIAEEILTQVSDPAWVKAMTHPLRADILELLRAEGPLSPVRATERLEGVSLGSVAYHFRRLQHLGLITEASQRQRRGAVEHTYQLVTSNGQSA